jgi:hypothetical protein
VVPATVLHDGSASQLNDCNSCDPERGRGEEYDGGFEDRGIRAEYDGCPEAQGIRAE